MKKMKKVAAASLALAVSATLLCGFSQTDREALEALNDSYDHPGYAVEGEVSDLDADGTRFNYRVEVDDSRPDNRYEHIVMNTEGFDQPSEMYVCGDKYYINKNIFRYIDRAHESYGGANVAYLLDELDRGALKDIEYIAFDEEDDYGLKETFNPARGIRGLEFTNYQLGLVGFRFVGSEAFVEYLAEALAGYTGDEYTSVETDNGYVTTVNKTAASKPTEEFLSYAYERKDMLYGAYSKFLSEEFGDLPEI